MTVLLDTNVVSELLRQLPDPAVESWVAERPATELNFSAVGEAELRYGVAILPAGRCRNALALAIEAILREEFEGRILPFDSDAAREYAEIASARRAADRAVAPADCQIAAIARSRGMAVATRNVRNLGYTGVEVVDPWTAALRRMRPRGDEIRRQAPFSPSATARMCSTPTPQQPPTIAAPASTQRLASARYTSGDTWSTKVQFGRVQYPALG